MGSVIKVLPMFSVTDNRKMNNFLNKCSPCVSFLMSQTPSIHCIVCPLTSSYQSWLSLIKPVSTHVPKHSVSQTFPEVQTFEKTSREMEYNYCNYCSCSHYCCEFFTMRKPVQNKLLDSCSL